MEFGAIALAVMAAFVGVGLYGALVELPASRELLDGDMLLSWRRVQPRRARMLFSLAMAGCFFGLVGLLWTGRALYLTGALFSVATWVMTRKWIAPVERDLSAVAPDTADAAVRARLEKWNMLYAVRAGIGFLAAVSFFAALP